TIFIPHFLLYQLLIPKFSTNQWYVEFFLLLLNFNLCLPLLGFIDLFFAAINTLQHPNTVLLVADPELDAIRQRRMQELMAQRGLGGENSQQNPEQQKAQDEAKREADERRQMMLAQILSAEARERLSRIALVKPEKAKGVEDVVLRAAQMGQIVEKVSEERLISLLEQINTQTAKQTKVTIQRRRSVLEDDD
ncbi:Programmed cell death protein 5, partial [Bienertia sinuspersici]